VRATVVAIALAGGTVFAFYLVWINRASEKILTAVIPIVVAALVGIPLAVFVFGGLPTISEEFPSSFQIRKASKMPANLPLLLMSRRFSTPLFEPSLLWQQHPELFNDPADAEGATLYHHLLQSAIIEWMSFRYHGSWQAEGAELELPIGRQTQFDPPQGANEPFERLSKEQLEATMNENKFATIHAGITPQITLPINTVMRIRAPHPDRREGEVSEIILRNDFCEISITTRQSSWFTGVGLLKSLAGLSDNENNDLATTNYIIKATARFNRMRSGHPKMPLYEQWANGLIAGLKQSFDEEIIWAKTKEDYLFFKQLKQLGPLKDEELNPHHKQN
jgi:hypothetical protein